MSYCFKVASFIEAFLNDTTFSSNENVALQRFVSQIVTFLKIFQGFSLFSYQCSLAVLCCISQRQLIHNSTSVVFCQQLFSSFFRNLFEVFRPEAFFLYFCFDSVPAVSSATALLYYHVPQFLSTAFFIYFLIYYFLNTIDVELPAMLPVHSVHQQDESPLFFLLHQDRLSVKYMSQIQVSPLLPLSVLPC